MDLEIMQTGTVLAIVVIAYLFGTLFKCIPSIPDEVIPVLVGFVGGILGVAGMYIIKDFPANDILNATAVGISSGLASTGLNQIVKQMSKLKETNTTE